MRAENPQSKNAILIVEDLESDRQLMRIALSELKVKNEVVFCENGLDALKHLRDSGKPPFMIISDINMPKMNGIEFKKEIDSDPHLALQAIPFIFMSCSFAPTEVERAYTQRPQGYFVKPDGIDALQDNLHTILKYWKDAVLPVTN